MGSEILHFVQNDKGVFSMTGLEVESSPLSVRNKLFVTYNS
jgi:hypothetical protein